MEIFINLKRVMQLFGRLVLKKQLLIWYIVFGLLHYVEHLRYAK